MVVYRTLNTSLEYTHLWDRVVAKKDPKLWKRGIELMKKTSLWEQFANDENYGLK